MELPIAPQSYRPTTDALVRAVKHARATLALTWADQTPLSGATALSDSNRPDVRRVNYAVDLHLPDGLEAVEVIREILTHYRQRGVSCQGLESAQAHWPPSLAQAAQSQGFVAVTKRVFLLDRHVPCPENHDLQVIPARAVYRQLNDFFLCMVRQQIHAQETVARDLAGVLVDGLDDPRTHYFVGRLNGHIVGVAGVTTLGQIGVIHPAYTQPHVRGRAVATTLMARTLDHCSRSLNQSVVIERTSGCPSIGFYERIGFCAVTSYTSYRRP